MKTSESMEIQLRSERCPLSQDGVLTTEMDMKQLRVKWKLLRNRQLKLFVGDALIWTTNIFTLERRRCRQTNAIFHCCAFYRQKQQH